MKWLAAISAPTSIRLSSADTELSKAALGLNLRLGKVTAHGAAGTFLTLAKPDTELNSRVAVFFFGALCHDLTGVQLQHGDRHVLTALR